VKLTLLWVPAILVAAWMLVAAGFQSRDPDSALYARLATELAAQPVSRWIAPEWNGAWDNQGLFREHPVGILLPSVVLIRAGFPAAQAAYAVNLAYQAAVILLIPLVAAAVLPRLQLMPVAFVYRIRANQEHPLFMCFLAIVYATHRTRERAAWMALSIAAFCFLVLVKGAFAMFALVSAALWIVVVPAPAGGSNRRAWVGLAGMVAAAAVMAVGYEAIYVRTTGESFIEFYRSTRLGQSMELSDPRLVPHAATNVVWYLGRLAWFAAPWTPFALGAGVLAWRRGEIRGFLATAAGRGVIWAALVAAVFIAVLSPANVRAERFIFPLYFIVGAIGAAAAIRGSAGFRRAVATADRYDWVPVAVWLALFVASLGSRLLR
jgi:hypothetical protein